MPHNESVSLASTPDPPYTAVIFTSIRSDIDDGYAEVAQAMDELAAEQPGYLGVESARESVGITISYWESPEAAHAWKRVTEHRLAQKRGRDEWYREYRVRIATVDREYGYASDQQRASRAKSMLAEQVLPLIRTTADLHRRSAATAHGRQMDMGLAILTDAFESGLEDPADVYTVTQKAIASATKLIMRADDSSGVMGDAIRSLLALHPKAAAGAQVQPSKLVKWMIDFQFHNDCDFFTIDPVAYLPALGDRGLARYRDELEAIRGSLGRVPADVPSWQVPDWHTRYLLDYNARRLAVADRDVDAIIATHVRDESIAAHLVDTAKAFEEIGRPDLAVEWARKAVVLNLGHQSHGAVGYLLGLLSAHAPGQVLAATVDIFERWPTADNATSVYEASGDRWPEFSDSVAHRLTTSPDDAVRFTLNTLNDPVKAWNLAHELSLASTSTWLAVIDGYESIDPLAVLPLLREFIESVLETADARNYAQAARHLLRMRTLAAGTDAAGEVASFISTIRQSNRHRPRLQKEFDKAGLP